MDDMILALIGLTAFTAFVVCVGLWASYKVNQQKANHPQVGSSPMMLL